ncbi:alpha/beta fold hydrolase [Chamaesiphon minutus]|uniref:Putative hydrolase or acyltransferase of alpha/beta superfamily n=1 Tax=Chamaesiphon minutus (strain ATCC 27169 / PCC 6605) TaxID=1173020 RepID=K9UI24_CHAP6|nr:alpha/beta hydrolase [Chamaesiphon minutus]AFY94757.1 putative hydrolase or acyltransferase of alpha/beta superfamily [Chamaesiphon minutus PCC 6605]
MAQVQSNTVQLNTVRLGNNGHPLVMLHGWGQNLQSLQPMGELLATKSQVHIIDLPGFGKSPPPPEDWDTANYADRIYQYLEESGIESADMLGHSFGGRVSIRLAHKYPQKVRSITLVNAGGLQRQRTLQQSMRSQWVRNMRNAFKISPLYRDALLTWHTQKYGSRDYLNAGAMRGTLVKTVSEDLTELAKQISVPVLLLWGEADTETPVEMGHRYHSLFANSELITIPNRDHFMFQAEGSHLCSYYVEKFLAQLSSKELSK